MSASARGCRNHVVIVGCGFGGLAAAKALGRAAVDVTVIDRTNHHLVQPLLHQLATGILSEGNIALPIRDLLRRQRNTRVVLGEVVDIDLHARRVTVDTIGPVVTITGGPSTTVATSAAAFTFTSEAGASLVTNAVSSMPGSASSSAGTSSCA